MTNDKLLRKCTKCMVDPYLGQIFTGVGGHGGGGGGGGELWKL